MGLQYENLDIATRSFMLGEIDLDVADGSIYVSSYLNERGCDVWPRLLSHAAEQGTDSSLAAALRREGCLRTFTERRRPRGAGLITVRVPYNAHETLGEAQFNVYYTRALCLRALEDGAPELEVYRAKAVAEPRRESQLLLGKRLSPSAILADLRSTKGVESALGLAQPNSGLTLRIPRQNVSAASSDAA